MLEYDPPISLQLASQEILKKCPQNQGAVIWYEECFIKYSNEVFFGTTDTVNGFYFYF